MDWKALLIGEDQWIFLLETAFRTAVMFTVILLGLRMLGKRGIKQLSVFELGVIIGLGSAAGDPMFYKDVGLLPGLIVFAVVLSLYRLVTWLVDKSSAFEQFVEGKPATIVEDGHLLIDNFKKETMAQDELFAELRLHSISHLGQVRLAILETNGQVSIYFLPDEEVKWGLPIIPQYYNKKLKQITAEGYYSCAYCGNTKKLLPAHSCTCNECGKKEWVKAVNNNRIT